MGSDAPPLRLRRFWLACGAAFVALVVYLSLAATAPDAGRLGEVKVGHFLAYAWLMFWYAQLFGPPGPRLAIAAWLVAMGVGLEYLQALTPHRGFAYADMRDNAIGVAAGLAAARWAGGTLGRVERLLFPRGPG